jgi:glutamine amidotransferase
VTRRTVGVIDYGIGNHASLHQTLYDVGHRCRISDDAGVLGQCDMLLLPGVGAFRPAMQALKAKALDALVAEQAHRGKPILGICLGMQMLAEASQEGGDTKGLGLIPGEVVSLGEPRWHIGWNAIETTQDDPIFRPSEGDSFFFNHSYAYKGPEKFQVCRATSGAVIAAGVRRDNVIGVQFHPEKSQSAGHALLKRIIEGLCHA